MPWSANKISPVKTIASLAQKVQPGGTLSLGGPRLDAPAVVPPAAATQTVNPTASQRKDPDPLPTMGTTGTQARDPRTAVADTSSLPSANALAAKVGKEPGLKDKKLGSRDPSSAPAAFNLLQTSTFQTPYAPEFLTNAVAGLNESQSYAALMHDEWRNRLLSETQNNPDLLPALTASSVQSGAHFSWGGGTGGSRAAAPAQRQPSYWEQKLAMQDLTDANSRMKTASNESNQMGVGLGTFMSPTDVAGEQARFKSDYLGAQQSANLARKVLGVRPTGQSTQAWDSATTWGARSNVPSGWW